MGYFGNIKKQYWISFFYALIPAYVIERLFWQERGIDVQGVERNSADRGFVPQPKRWMVEQTFGILSFRRRLVRDYEHRLASSASRVYWAMADVMARRLTVASAPSWRAA